MSVFKTAKSAPYYWYDFQIGGHRFHGSTKCKTRREAEDVERQERERAKQRIAETEHAAVSLEIDHAADRYWIEVGQHHACADNTERDLARLVEYFGKAKLLTEITDDNVAKLVAWRRGHRVPRKVKPDEAPFISNSTVNRTTTEVLKKLFTRAKRAWGIRFRQEPNWNAHMLPEPEERPRELHEDEAERIDEAMRFDFAPLFDFVRTTGVRQKEALLRWPEVNWKTGHIIKKGKGGKTITVRITPAVRAILWPLRGHHPDAVFTYVAQRTIGEKLVKGQRYPITVSGLNSRWRRTRKTAGVTDFRFHDFRHDFGTKLMRQERNPKLVQRALNHADFKTTARYMHVLDEEVGEAVERLAKSRGKSRVPLRKVE